MKSWPSILNAGRVDLPDDGISVPFAVNPFVPEFIQIAKHPYSTYKIFKKIYRGVRILILNWDTDEPDILIYPGNFTHYEIAQQLIAGGAKVYDHDLQHGTPHLIWEDNRPRILADELDPYSCFSEPEVIKLKHAINKLPIPITRIKAAPNCGNRTFLKVDCGLDKDPINLREPWFATLIREYHT